MKTREVWHAAFAYMCPRGAASLLLVAYYLVAYCLVFAFHVLESKFDDRR
jgi:hypothetical protein